MRRAANLDGNHVAIVDALRAVGATVTSTASLGGGFVDLVVGYRGANYLLEVKDGSLPPSRRKLTPREQAFHDGWRGQTAVVETVEQAVKAIGAIK